MVPNSSRLSGPTPEVIYIPALFRRIQQGDIREPAFQRGFIWTEDKVVDLLKSIYQGFPVGSLLFWRVHESVLKVETPRLSVFPVIEERYPCSFILEGLQRLSSLYAVFHYKPDMHLPLFRVFFNLDTDEFEAIDEGDTPVRSVPMWQLFSPKEFIEFQRQISSLADADALLEKAIDLHSRFQEYLIPTVTISGRSPSDVVQVFERVNNTAITLSSVDFMRAVTWSENFDLNAEIDEIAKPLVKQGFTIPAETVVKVLAVSMGKEPTPESMLQLRSTSSSDLHAGVGRSQVALQRSIDFLMSNYRIYSYDFVPYEGQLLALSRFFDHCQVPTPYQLSALRRWFWSVSFNEGLRGKPDHYVTRILHRVDRLAAGDLDALKERFLTTATDFLERRFIRGKALSSAIAAMFAVRGARSFLTGEVIPPSDYMTEFVVKNFQALLSTEELQKAGRTSSSNKILSNIILMSSADASERRASNTKDFVSTMVASFETKTYDIFESQFITVAGRQALESGDYETFVNTRAATMFLAASTLASDTSD